MDVSVGEYLYYWKSHEEAETYVDGSVRNCGFGHGRDHLGCYRHCFDTAFAEHVAVAGDYIVLADSAADTNYFANQYYIAAAGDVDAAAAADDGVVDSQSFSHHERHVLVVSVDTDADADAAAAKPAALAPAAASEPDFP